MKKVIFIMLMACMAGAAYAQPAIDSIGLDKKNELMLSLKTLHAQSNTPGGIMYRRNFKNVSLRVGVNGTYYRRHSSSSINYENFTIASSIGLQRNYKLNNYFDIYWGADLVYTYNENIKEESALERTNFTNSLGVSPLLGIRYKYKRLVLGIETSGNFSYTTERQYEVSTDPLIIPENSYRESMNFNPISSTKFFIGIRF